MRRALPTVLFAGYLVALAAASGPGAPVEMPQPRGYVAVRAGGPVAIDGRLTDAAWQRAPWTDLFVDIEGDAKPRPALATRAKMVWDDTFFYVAAELDEPQLWSTIATHDAVIFREHDFEVFIDPDGDSHDYYEFEINARGTFWDLLLPKPYRAGGRPLNSWEIPGLMSAVSVDGTLNNPRDTDRRWSVELAFPWAVLGEETRQPAPPRDGDQWRVNFSRVEWPLEVVNGAYRPVKGANEHNWVWSPQLVVDMHRPERWGYVQFSTAEPGATTFVPDASAPARRWLQAVYEAQREFRMKFSRYAATLEELGVAAPADPSLTGPGLWVTPSLFEATIDLRTAGRPAETWHVRDDARVWRE